MKIKVNTSAVIILTIILFRVIVCLHTVCIVECVCVCVCVRACIIYIYICSQFHQWMSMTTPSQREDQFMNMRRRLGPILTQNITCIMPEQYCSSYAFLTKVT